LELPAHEHAVEMTNFVSAYNWDDYDWFRREMLATVREYGESERSEIPHRVVVVYDCGNFLTYFLNSGLHGYLCSPYGGNFCTLPRLFDEVQLMDVATQLRNINHGIFGADPIQSDQISQRLDTICAVRGIHRIDEDFNLKLPQQVWTMLRKYAIRIGSE
jgi:hypothetical protein